MASCKPPPTCARGILKMCYSQTPLQMWRWKRVLGQWWGQSGELATPSLGSTSGEQTTLKRWDLSTIKSITILLNSAELSFNIVLTLYYRTTQMPYFWSAKWIAKNAGFLANWRNAQLGGSPVNSSFYEAAVAELSRRWGQLELLVVRSLAIPSHQCIAYMSYMTLSNHNICIICIMICYTKILRIVLQVLVYLFVPRCI